MNFRSLFGNVRFYILIFSVVFSILTYIYIRQTTPDGVLQIIRLTQIYALTAVTFLYFAVLAGPLCYIFRFLPFRAQYLKGRRAIGVSAFYFGWLHASLAFFGQLGGFPGLFYLEGKYLLAITFSFIALVILTLMASTSFDALVARLGFARWKMLHRFVYLVVVLITIHALLLGTHFSDLSGLIPQIFFGALSVLLLLEANRFDAFLQRKFLTLPRLGPTLTLTFSLILFYVLIGFLPDTGNIPSLGIHAQHIQIAKDAQNANSASNLPNIPSLQGDRTRRFSVNFDHPENIAPNTDTKLSFKVFDASSGNQILLFSRVYEKPMHLIVVDSSLNYFNHIHPEQVGDSFVINTSFPKAGVYHLYVDFQPLGAIEQQFAFTLNVGDNSQIVPATTPVDTNFDKVFGQVQVKMDFASPLNSNDLSIGKHTLKFTLSDAVTKQPITNLKPYLAAFGHLVMINESTYDYIHVHPTNLTAPAADANGGPVVEFMPLGLYGPIKPGIYRVFAQFNPGGNLMVADFTVKVE